MKQCVSFFITHQVYIPNKSSRILPSHVGCWNLVAADHWTNFYDKGAHVEVPESHSPSYST